MYRLSFFVAVILLTVTGCRAAGQKAPVYELMPPDEEALFMEELRREVPDAETLAGMSGEEQFGLLDRAAYLKSLAGVRYLLGLGIDVNLKEASGRNTLHYPAWNGVFPIVKLLVESGIDVNSEYNANGGLTPLNCAVESGLLETVVYLIEHGGDPFYSNDETGSSPLRSAAYSGNTDVFLFLAGLMPPGYDWHRALGWAIIGGDLDIIKYVVEEKKADVGKELEWWGYPMHLAAERVFGSTNVEIMEYLLSRGASFKQINGGAIFPWALDHCNEQAILYFIEKGYDPGIMPSGGGDAWTGLAKALDEGRLGLAEVMLAREDDFTFRGLPLVVYFADGMYDSPEIIAFLIENGVNKEYYGEALLRSAAAGDAESVGLLLEAGTDANFTDEGHNALALTESGVVARLLIEHGCDTQNRYALEKLCTSFEVLRAYVESGVGVALTSEELGRGLVRAAYLGEEWAVEYLLSQGADPDALHPPGGNEISPVNALMANAMQGYSVCSYSDGYVVPGEIARMLIEAGADITATDPDGRTALHLAAASYRCRIDIWPIPMGNRQDRQNGAHGDPAWPPGQSKEEVVELLLGAGADVNARDTAGDTPLHLAVRARNNARVISLLLQAGADLDLKGSDGRTAMQNMNDPEVLDFILASGQGSIVSPESLNESMEEIIRGGSSADRADRIARLLDGGADIDHKLYGGEYNALIYLIKNGYDGWFGYESNRRLVELLVGRGIDRDGRNRDGQTALHVAAKKKGNYDLMKYLLDNGFDLDARDRKGNTPLIYAAMNDDRESAELLVDKGADPNIVNNDRASALTVAVVRGNADLRMLLEAEGAVRDRTAEWWYAVGFSYGPGSLDHIRRLAREGFDVDTRSSYVVDHRSSHEVKEGITALLYFAGIGNERGLELMIDLGADINARNPEGLTAMGVLKNKRWTNASELYEFLKKKGGTE